MGNLVKTVREHRCKRIDKIEIIGVEKIRLPNDEKERWFFRVDTELNEIIYCPYCGERLEGAEQCV